MKRLEMLLLSLGIAGVAASALATETINYTYDARGRLVKVARSGTVNNSVNTSYTIDKADNRTNKTVTGESGARRSRGEFRGARARRPDWREKR